MRAILFGLASMFVASLPAHAEWKQYRDASLGVYNYFPVTPTKTKTTYKPIIRLALGKPAPATVVSAVDDGVTYKVEVVDYSKSVSDSANILEEALDDAVSGRGTTYTVTDFPRWDLGKNSVYGTALMVDKADNDKTHILEDIVFNKGRLYIISASVPANAPGRYSSGLARFIDTSQFHLAGYGYNYETGHDYPLGDNDPNDRDLGQNRPGPHPLHKAPPGLVTGPLKDGLPL
jgi:hypothetical protein